MKSMWFFTTVVFHLALLLGFLFDAFLSRTGIDQVCGDVNQAVSNYPLSRVICWWSLHLPHFLFQKNLERKFPFHLQDLTMTLSNNTNTIILRAPLSAAKQMPQSSVMENCTEGFFRKNWKWSSNKLNMARHMLFSPFALRLRYDNPNNLFQVQEGGRSFGGSRETERAFGQIKVRNFDDLFLEVNNFERNLATVAHVRRLGGPMGGHIHSGPRMAMSGDRNSFTLDLTPAETSETSSRNLWIENFGKIWRVQGLSKTSSSKNDKHQFAWYQRNIWSSRLQLSGENKRSSSKAGSSVDWWGMTDIKTASLKSESLPVLSLREHVPCITQSSDCVIFRLRAWCNIGVNDLWLYDPVDGWIPRGGHWMLRGRTNWTAALGAASKNYLFDIKMKDKSTKSPRVCETFETDTAPLLPFRSFQRGVSERQVQHSVRFHVKGLFVGDREILVGTGASCTNQIFVTGFLLQ